MMDLLLFIAFSISVKELYIFSCVTGCSYQNKSFIGVSHHITYLSTTFRTLTLIYCKNVAYHTGVLTQRVFSSCKYTV